MFTPPQCPRKLVSQHARPVAHSRSREHEAPSPLRGGGAAVAIAAWGAASTGAALASGGDDDAAIDAPTGAIEGFGEGTSSDVD
jgi:hypothetical protein